MTTAREVKVILKDAWHEPSKIPSAAIVYIAALDEAEAMYGSIGVKTQILYILTNLRAMIPEQKEAKNKLKEMAKY